MSGRIFGYARVSTTEQNLDRQLEALKEFVPNDDNIVCDKASGKDLDRHGYNALKSPLGLRSGDTLVIKSLDRLSRNKNHIKQEIEWFTKNKIRLKVIDLPTTLIETQGQEWIIEMINNIIIEVLASMAEQERLNIKQRQLEGIAVAKKKGKHLGRPKLTYDENKLKNVLSRIEDGKLLVVEAMTEMGLSKASWYRTIKEFEQKGKAAAKSND